MEELRFEQLKNLTVPERFYQTALDIPRSQPPKRRPWFLSPKAVSAAAALLMLLVGFSLFTHVFGNRPITERAKHETTQATTVAKNKPRSVAKTSEETRNADEDETVSHDVQPVTVMCDGRVYTVAPPVDASRAAAQAVSEPSEKSRMRQNGNTAASDARQLPSSGSASEVPAVTSAPCALTEPLTEPCAFTEPAAVPTTNPGGYKPPTEPATEVGEFYFRGKLQTSFKMGDYPFELYCTILDSRGNAYGGDRATAIVLADTGDVTVYYIPSARGIKLPCETYTAVFRDANGTVAAQGSFTVDHHNNIYTIPTIR